MDLFGKNYQDSVAEDKEVVLESTLGTRGRNVDISIAITNKIEPSQTEHLESDCAELPGIVNDSAVAVVNRSESVDKSTLCGANILSTSGDNPTDLPCLPLDDVQPLRLTIHSDISDAKDIQSRPDAKSLESGRPESMAESGSSTPQRLAHDSDDFYSLYNVKSFSPTSPDGSQGAAASPLESAIEYPTESLPETSASSESSVKQPFSSSWMDFTAPANVQSLCLTNRHIWFVDKNFHVHHSALGGPSLKWNILADPAKYIAVSPDGWIVWRLYKNVIYVGTNIAPGYPAGRQWREIAKDVAHVSVDNNVAWLVCMCACLFMSLLLKQCVNFLTICHAL